jgi:hypothetical protein
MTTNKEALKQAREVIAGLREILIGASTDAKGKRFAYIESRSRSLIHVTQAILDAEQALAAIDQAPVAPSAQPVAWIGRERFEELKRGSTQTMLTNWRAFLDDEPLYAAPVAAQPIPEWISADEKLPPDETPVIILRNGVLDIGELRWEHPTCDETYKAFRYWDSPSNDGQDWEWDSVTHWMELPEPPAPADKGEG